jgi:flagellar assembly factor FliW
MRNFSFFRKSILLSLLIALMVCPVSFSQAGAVKMAYNFPSDNPVKYLTVSNIVQTMDVMGQVMEVNVASVLGCSIKSKGLVEKNLNLEVTIDSMYQKVDSPQGSAGGVLRDAMGKVFIMTISPEGKEVDLSEAGKIVINIEGSGPVDASQSFDEFFPDLPSGAVNPGFSWSVTDTLKTKSASNSAVVTIKYENKFEGFEDFNGMRCAKITSVLSGDRLMITQSQGMDITVKGPFTGTSDFFFSVDKGYFLKQTVKTKLTGTIEITSPENMSFPVIMDMTSVNEVLK